MGRTKKKSRKLSAANSDSLRKQTVFFVDRSLGKRFAVEALRAAGFTTIAHDEKFAPDTYDEDWLEVAGREGWVVVTKDRRIRYRESEITQLKEARVIAFVLTSGDQTGLVIADLLAKHAIRMAILASTTKPPAMFSLNRSGGPTRIDID